MISKRVKKIHILSKRASHRGLQIIKKVWGPVERIIERQPVPARYTRGGVTIVIGTVNLINPLIPGRFFIAAGVSIIHKTRKGVIHCRQKITILTMTSQGAILQERSRDDTTKNVGLSDTIQHVLQTKREQLIQNFVQKSIT